MPRSNDRGRLDRRRRQLLGMLGGGATLGLAGCAGLFDDGAGGGDGGDGGGDAPPPDEIPMDGEFVASLAANPSTFDPTIVADSASADCTNLMYEPLVMMDWNNDPVAALTEDWEQEDETTYRFDLREGVEFHHGEEMTAEDVEHSFVRMIGTVQDATVSAWYEDSEVVDDYTIRFFLSQQHAPFLTDVLDVPIVPADIGDPEEDDTLEDESRGTGPFVLENFQPEDRVEFSRNEDYWFEETDDMPGMAPWESLTLRIVVEQTAQQQALQTGELDLIDNANPVDLGDLDAAEETNVEATTGQGHDFLAFPVQTEPYTNPKFRRGMRRLIPVDDVIEAIWSGYAEAIGGPISPGLPNIYDEEFDQQLRDEFVGENREEAERLLDEAFEEEGLEKPFEVNFITNENATRERWMEVIQQELDSTEYFDANLDIQAFDALVPFLLGGDAAESTDVVGIGWSGGFDPDGHVNQLLHSDEHVPDGFNWILYENDEVDRLIEEGRETVDPDERRQIYQDLSEILAEEVPYAFMWTSESYEVHRTDAVTNWRSYPNETNTFIPLYRPYLDQVAWQPE